METIRKRQSIRKFKKGEVTQDALLKILEAGRLAPSGKNSQNWHFLVIRNRELMEKIAAAIVAKNDEIATAMDSKDREKGDRFRKFAKNFTLFYLGAPVLIVVYATDYYPTGYHEYRFAEYPESAIDKLFQRNPGMQSIGAAIENMSLEAVELGYGSCWMTGQNYAADEIEKVLEVETGFSKEGYFLACMLAIGIPEDGAKSPGRKDLSEICTFID
jgi:nitroreductase